MSGDAHSRDALEQVLAYRFKDRALLEGALTHPSAGEASRRPQHYERLEFLGDRVLSLVMAELLLARYPGENEGELTRRLAGLVRRESLLEIARAIGLERFLRMSAASGRGAVRERETALADGCEALIGALYLDGGLEAAGGFIRRAWASMLEAAVEAVRDPKTELQEWAQGRGDPLPTYIILEQEGPAHRPIFTVEVRVAGVEPRIGRGGSKRAAEQDAAEALLKLLEGHE